MVIVRAVQNGGWQTFSVKVQRVKVLGFVGHMVSITATQLCHHRAMENMIMNEDGCVQ